ncbi:GPI transamidase component PIG-T [Lactarius psammicola]|nr:GPI transamidase component PIG-T [Lactarius psammicola]
MKWSILFLFLSRSFAATSATEEYREKLTLQPLVDGKLSAHFSFSTLLRSAVPRAPSTQHYTLFPLALGQILREHAIPEFHLTINSGKWDYDRWGTPRRAWRGLGSGTVGVDGRRGFSADEVIDARWKALQNSLSGLFCASLGSMDALHTTSPAHAFPPTGDLPLLPAPPLPERHAYTLRHATLPAERVCTENLTPFLKLLPCPSRAGVAALLEPHRIFDADWHDLGVHVRWRADTGVELTLTVQAVLDSVRTSTERRRDWTLESLFGRSLPRSCNVASSSVVRVVLPSDESAYTLSPEPQVATEAGFAVYDITNGTSDLNIAMKWPEEERFSYPLDIPPLADLSVRRTLKGSSQTHGELSVVVRNNRPVPVRTHYLETMPWHVEFFLHTLSVTCGDRGAKCESLLTNITYTPSQPHATPAQLLATLDLPPHETLHLSLRVRKAFLRCAAGVGSPPAVFVPLDAPHRRIYTPALLVDLATPDFSMPYNVIIMSSTLIALIFGSLFNMLIRRFVVIEVDSKAG